MLVEKPINYVLLGPAFEVRLTTWDPALSCVIWRCPPPKGCEAIRATLGTPLGMLGAWCALRPGKTLPRLTARKQSIGD